MPKTFKNRIEILLSELKSLEAIPLEGPPPEGEAGQSPIGPRPDIPTPPEPVVDAPVSLPAPTVSSLSALRSDWAEFLDGIRRESQLNFVYDPSGVQPVEKIEPFLAQGNRLDAAIEVAGESIGQIILDGGSDHAWTDDDLELVNAVAQRLAQQIETLRLLDEAERSQKDAAQAFQRLAFQSGQKTGGTRPLGNPLAMTGWIERGSALSFLFANDEVSMAPQAVDTPGNGHVHKTPLRIGDEVAGQLEVSRTDMTPDEAGLVEMVADRVSQRVENLRLLEQSRHFRQETEDAIRRLTYQSWQAYLAASEKTGLGFAFDTHRVEALPQDLPIQGAAFPLKVRDEVIGQLAVENPSAGPEEAAGLIDVIADRLGSHLDGLRLAEQREQALAETEVMYGVSARLSTAQSLEDALTSVSEPARASGVRDSRLFFITLDERGQPEGLTLSAIWYPDVGAQLVPAGSHFLLEDHPTYWKVLRDPENPLLVGDIFTDPRLDVDTRDLLERTGDRSVAVLPLAISGRWVGAIFLNWDQPHVFSEQENRLYASLSRQAAVVVNNRLLLEQTRRRAQELQTVAQVSTAASTILDPRELLQTVVDLTKSSFSLYHAQVYLINNQLNVLEVTAGAGETGRMITEGHLFVPAGSQAPVARAARTRQVVIVNDTANEPGFVHNMFLPEVRAEMAIPMVVGERLLGVFNVQANTTNRFSREDARIYTTLASQVAVAMQNAELYAEQAATVERLRELDHLKTAFLANMSHELRTPLNSILGFAEVLLLELDGPLTETMTNDIHLIEKNGKHLLSLINDVLDMAKIEAGKMNLAFEKFVLRDLIEETMDITSSLVREKGLYLKIAEDSQDRMDLIADRIRIRQVMINIVSNAVKFTERGGITIRVVQNPEERKLHLVVQDTGIGIPPDKLEMIFESFSQVDTSTTRKVGGTGLGLPISRRLVEMHGGRLWAESTGKPGEGSAFNIELPFEAVKR
jgi:signal transduction histidine kinase